ncbi:DNA repair protein RecO [Candidatus Gottesmanbacteria bacterium RBG_16_52_11]|uniref:DNA repair protein RecO n=1 Tax=Candidatus Gottesmanbacteria bacterium RBG_16_52_11 TaxID=1798374 RepID=A0A1F5YUL7_9BACT|nr:MAG: DNA repair protein RecO [Candidatus Gottesmanbacteria bacterium RBG_16_52_11]
MTRTRGKIRLIARGVRRIYSRRAGHTEPFRLVRMTVSAGKSNLSLSEIVTLESFPRISEDLQRTGYAYFLCEIADKLLPEGDVLVEPYRMTLEMLRQINDTENPRILHKPLTGFVNRLLMNLGFLAPGTVLSATDVIPTLERITERSLKTPPVLRAFRL